ncbi:MAG: type II secretion system F family protein, partial [Xanthomonadales bacterium]|nr:type II secretion system F family protein [Xanthomonadales bacterium]
MATKAATTSVSSTALLTFTWEGKDKRGMVLKGEELGKNANLVKAELRRRGINPTRVNEKRAGLFSKSGKAITPREIAIFSRQLATMIQAGVPLVQSFDIIAGGQANPRFKELLTKIKGDVEGGATLNEALAKYPVQFDELYVNLVRAGEGAGVLDTVLDTIATYKENIETLKGKIKKALIYPSVVIAVALIVSAILLIFVVPQFQNLFKSFGAELPAFTQMIVTASDFMIGYWWAVLIVVGGTIFGLVALKKRSPAFAHSLERMMLRLPVVGMILHNSAIARFARTL